MTDRLLTMDDLHKRTGLSAQYFKQMRTVEKKEGRDNERPRIPKLILIGNRLRCTEEDYREWLITWRGKYSERKEAA